MNILSEQLLNLPGYEIEKIVGVKSLRVHARQINRICCIRCTSNKLHIKSAKERVIRHQNFATREVYLHLYSRKFRCTTCNAYFWERFPGIQPYNNKTEPFRKQIAQYAFRGITRKDISQDYRIGEATVYRYFIKELQIKSNELMHRDCPKILGIDEHFFTKKKGYATTLCDLSKHRIFDVVLGRSEKSLNSYFRKLKGKENVRVVVMDLSETYRSIIKKHFPQAKIVSDRFHVIRLVNHHFLSTWKQIDPVGRYNRGLLSLMRRHAHNLSFEQKTKLATYFERFPELKAIYDFKQHLCTLLCKKHKTKKQCKKLVRQFLGAIEQLKSSMIKPMVTLGETLEKWSKEVVRMWRFTKSNGITEGFHNKMKMLVRRAFGFRNFENYRLWVKILCA